MFSRSLVETQFSYCTESFVEMPEDFVAFVDAVYDHDHLEKKTKQKKKKKQKKNKKKNT